MLEHGRVVELFIIPPNAARACAKAEGTHRLYYLAQPEGVTGTAMVDQEQI